jgi:FAD/FMN-containing dehydrogenase
MSDDPALTQTFGWVDAWVSRASAYAVAARRTADVVAAVDFARTHRLRLVVKGGGHSYQGTSNAADSLLVWTRGCRDRRARGLRRPGLRRPGQRRCAAVSVGAGALWSQVYDAVTTRPAGYVQGGGCMSVGRRRAGAERRLRQLLEGLGPGVGQPARRPRW